MNFEPFANELIITVIGGVLTAFILNLFSGKSKPQQQQVYHQPQQARPSRSGGSLFGQFIHVLLSVAGGVALAIFASRFLFRSGILERGLPMRMVILVASTIFVWWVLLLFRGKR